MQPRSFGEGVLELCLRQGAEKDMIKMIIQMLTPES